MHVLDLGRLKKNSVLLIAVQYGKTWSWGGEPAIKDLCSNFQLYRWKDVLKRSWNPANHDTLDQSAMVGFKM